MSFGYSVGDFIAVYQLANQLRERFADAPSQFKAISDEVTGLSNLLRDIERMLSQQVLTDWQKKALTFVLGECHNVLIALGKVIDENYYLNPSNVHGFFDKSRRVWKRLTWELNDIHELQSRLALNIGLLNAFNGSLISKVTLETKEEVKQLHKRHDMRERQEEDQAILDWLTPTDYAAQQYDFISRRQEGTGQWLLDSTEFQRWLDTDKQTLFCPGIPGTGKTILTAVTINDLTTRFQNNPGVGIAYLYCNFRRKDEQKALDLLASLLKQLSQEQSSLPDCVKSLYYKHKKKQTRPSLDEISGTLQSVANIYSRVIIIVDALDECQVSNGCRTTFLTEIFSLQTKTGANLFMTSRPIPEITEKFIHSMSLEIRASEEDVRRYLEGHMSKLPTFVGRSSDLQEELKTGIVKAVDGMFLLAQLHLDSLVGIRSPKAIRTVLRKLATGNNTYDIAYNDAMERIKGQVKHQYDLAQQVLLWITYARRPLFISELQHALAVEVGEAELDEENLPQVEDMISVCAGLVTIDKESNIIRLVHYTTQEFFERTRESLFLDAETEIATICVTYLSFNAFKSGFCQTDNTLEKRLRSNYLYEYAAQNWGHHARRASTSSQLLNQAIVDFLESKAKVEASSQALLAIKRWPQQLNYSQEFRRQMTGFHLVAYFGLEKTVNALLEKGVKIDSKDTAGWTPLSWAAWYGHEAMAQLLLMTGNIDADSKDNNGQTPLSLAAQNGHSAIVQLLLTTGRVNADSKDQNRKMTPLLLAAYNGHSAVVKLLLATGKVNVNSKDYSGETPLSYAAGKGDEAVVWLLLGTGKVNADSENCEDETPLSLAACNGHTAIVQLLLATGKIHADWKVSNPNYPGQTPLSLAAQNGHVAVVQLLLATGKVDINSKGDYGQTPLSLAAENGHVAVVQLLLTTGNINADSKNICGQTPLSQAACNGHEAVVKLLLATDNVDIDSQDEWGLTPLSRAAENGRMAVIQQLLDKGAQLELKDNTGRTLLSIAADNGHEAVVKLLLAKKNVNFKSNDYIGRSPLLFAAERGYGAAANLLLKKDGINQIIEDENSPTPVSWIVENELKTVIQQVLKMDDVDLNIKDVYDRTPLSWAAENGHEVVVKLLLEKDVELESTNSTGKTPLSIAAHNGHITVVKLLLENGAQLNTTDHYVQTPLDYASSEELKKLLLEMGAK